MKKFLLGVLIGFLFTGFAMVILLFAMARVASRPPAIASDSILVYRLEGALPEKPGVEIPIPFFQEMSPPTVRDHWELLRKAAADSRVRGIVFMPEGVSAGWAKLDEIRSGLAAFRKSGKPVYAYLRAPGAREYYLAAAADRIYMAPEDFLDLKGLRAELTYFKGTLDKIGVRIEIERAGNPGGRRIGIIRVLARAEELVPVVLGVHAPGQGQLAVVAEALEPLGFEFALVEGRQQQAGQYGNDRNDHQQLDERETAGPGVPAT